MYCKTCFGEHEEEIHAATLRVREWLRDQVLLGFEVEEEPELDQQSFEIALTAAVA